LADFDLERFVEAQAATYAQALAELESGRKESHWMWFVFPQVAGLGFSAMAQHYAIGSLAEARAYLAHPRLGPRLREAAEAVLAHRDKSAKAIFGPLDAIKFRSSLTLFEAAAEGDGPFGAALDAFYGGERDAATRRLLGQD
jgi:uncharacterized protein (DUF1810 family)